jgi:LuxR family maltose regulon positive regulatory protein
MPASELETLADPAPSALGQTPRPATGLVPRPQLVRRLHETTAPLAVLHAPAGYGKTALLTQWAATEERDVAWVDLVAASGDAPAALLGALARQLDDPDGRRLLVLDGAHALADPQALAPVLDVALLQRPGSLIALATRAEPPLPLGRLRVEGAVLELGVDDLTLTDAEATALLREADPALTTEQLAALCACGEGWPAALRLAVLALREQPDTAAAVARFGGDDRFVADYLRQTLLTGMAPAQVDLLTRGALLGELSGPLCDDVLERRGCGALLRALARAGLPLRALDRGEQRFRLHPLLAGMLAAELRRSSPEAEPLLHRRASAWHAQAGDVARALDHALAGDDAVRVGELLWGDAPAHAGGSADGQLSARLARFDDATIAAQPALALSVAVERLARGDRDGAERWADAAAAQLTDERADATLAAGLATVRAGLARGGAETLLADAERARALAGDGVWRSSAALLAGVAQRLLGAPDTAREQFVLGARPGAVPTPAVRALSTALLALLELERCDGQRALALVESALAELERAQLADDPGCALVHAVAACARAQDGQVEAARRDVDRSRRLLAALPDPAAWYVAETDVALARALLRLSDAAAARALLGEAGRALRALPDAVGLQSWLDDAWERADSFALGAVGGPSALTIAELRVLRFLPSHLSLREIAARLHVSANTVKTQAHAVYRKLDATSRSEAVARASLIGLIDC